MKFSVRGDGLVTMDGNVNISSSGTLTVAGGFFFPTLFPSLCSLISNFGFSGFVLSEAISSPGSNDGSCVKGTIKWDATYVYVCINTSPSNGWRALQLMDY